MKQRYEDRIAELVKETEQAEQSRDLLEERLNRAVEAGRRLQSQLSVVSATVPASKDDASSVQDEVSIFAFYISVNYSLMPGLTYFVLE